MGLVEKSELDKRTNEYALTDEGLETVLDQLEWVFSNVATDEGRTERLYGLVEQFE
jgi:DNA-binding PadR family transcriptional regulator